jgi:hypothetical protein
MSKREDNRRRRKLVEIGNCPLCGGYIMCPADHDRDCERYGDSRE